MLLTDRNSNTAFSCCWRRHNVISKCMNVDNKIVSQTTLNKSASYLKTQRPAIKAEIPPDNAAAYARKNPVHLEVSEQDNTYM